MRENRFFQRPATVFFLAVAVTLLWGSAFPIIKIGYASFAIEDGDIASKMLFAGVRFFIAGLMVFLLYSAGNKKPILPRKGQWRGILILGVVQTAMQYGFFYVGLAHISGVRGSLTYSINSFLAVFLAHFFCREDRMTVRKLTGCLLGFFGVALVNLGGDTTSGGFSVKGEGMLVIAALCLASGALLSKKVAFEGDVFAITAFQMMFGGIMLTAVGAFFGGGIFFDSGKDCMVLGYLSASSAVSFCAWTLLLKYNQVGKVAVYNFLMPVFGVLLSGLFLAEKVLTAQNISALTLVCAGILVVNWIKKEEN